MKEKLAMPCTEQQWEQEIKPRIEKIGTIESIRVYNLEEHPYLVNNWDNTPYRIGNGDESFKNGFCRKLIPYDPDRFCASLGEVKWMPLTRGGYEYKIYEEFEGTIWGRIFHNQMWGWCGWNIKGGVIGGINIFDLIPYNPEIEAIKQEIAIKEKELEELKSKLNK